MPRIDINRTDYGCSIYCDGEFLGSVLKSGELVFEASKADHCRKDIPTFEAAVQWILDPESPRMEAALAPGRIVGPERPPYWPDSPRASSNHA